MSQSRLTIAKLLGLILLFGIVFAGLRSGSDNGFKLIYSLTFLALVYAAIAARYRGDFWYGFAIAGWAYFVVGYGPWIGSPSAIEELRGVNKNLVTVVVLEFVPRTMSQSDLISPGQTGPAQTNYQMHWLNREVICHCGLTLLFGFVGGLVSRALARRPTTEG